MTAEMCSSTRGVDRRASARRGRGYEVLSGLETLLDF